MAIVTIFGGTFGDDEEIARNVATTLGSLFVSRYILADAARRAAVPEAKLDELIEKEPRWWAGWQENLRPYRIAQMGVSSAVTTIVGAARLDEYQSTVDSAQALADLALTARVQATLLRTLGTPSLLINVLAKEKEVYLCGTLATTIADEEIRTLVESVTGVEKVLTDFETMPREILRYG